MEENETCHETCESCEESFEISTMHEDDGSNWFCAECWKDLKDAMYEDALQYLNEFSED